MPEFYPAPDGARLVLDSAETSMLRQLTAELRALLAGTRTDDDPVMERLFPRTYDSVDDQAAYEDIVGETLTREKLEALDAISTTLGDGPTDVTLDGDTFGQWLACLTDLRLAIGTRIGVDEERMAQDVSPRDPDAQALTILHWLGWIQDGLLRAAAA